MTATATVAKPPLKGRDPKKQLAAALKEQRQLVAKTNKDKHEIPFLQAFAEAASVKNLPMPVRDFQFSKRKWKLDFAWPWLRVAGGERLQLAIEIHGGTQSRRPGRHNRAAGMANDREKVNAAIALGWTVLEFTDKHTTAQMVDAVVKAMTKRK